MIGLSLRTALTPALWGSTYAVTTLLLQDQSPGWMTVFRLLPTGIMIWLFYRTFPKGVWWYRSIFMGAGLMGLMFFVFIAAYRLPGGMAGTIMATLPLQTLFFMWLLRGQKPAIIQILAAICGLFGVALLVLKAVHVDFIGVLAALSACFMTFLTALKSKEWGLPPEGIGAYVSWQLSVGGAFILPFVFLIEGYPPEIDQNILIAFVWIGFLGVGWASINWLKGILQLPLTTIAFIGLVNPISAVLCGQLLVQEEFRGMQWLGIFIIFASILSNLIYQQKRMRRAAS